MVVQDGGREGGEDTGGTGLQFSSVCVLFWRLHSSFRSWLSPHSGTGSLTAAAAAAKLDGFDPLWLEIPSSSQHRKFHISILRHEVTSFLCAHARAVYATNNFAVIHAKHTFYNHSGLMLLGVLAAVNQQVEQLSFNLEYRSTWWRLEVEKK